MFELPSRDRVEDRVRARPVAARAALAVGARIVEGDVGIVPPDALLAEPQFRRALETHVMMDELGPFEEALQDRLRPGLGQVEREAALRARRRLIIAVHEADAVAGQRLDLDDEIGRAHAELQSLMRISYAVFCLQK